MKIIGSLSFLLLFATSVSATPVLFCKDGPGIDLVNDGCISGTAKDYPGGGDGVYSNAGGGDPESAVEAAILGATGTAVNITHYGKTDINPSLFSIVSALDNKSGSWDVIDDSISIAYITVKAANSFALYAVGGVNSGLWSTAGILNNGGSQPAVSHIAFWTTGPGDPQGEIPEPATMAMTLLGVGALSRIKRAKRS